MKNLLVILAIVCSIGITNAQKKKTPTVKEVKYECTIHCDNCKKKIMTNIPYEKGVKDVKVSVEDKTVTVKYRDDKNNNENIKEAIEELGYEATEVPITSDKE